MSSDFDILAQRFIDGDLQPDDVDRLALLLRQDPALRRVLARHVELDEELKLEGLPDLRFSVSDFFSKPEQLVDCPQDVSLSAAPHPCRTKTPKKQKTYWTFPYALGLLVLLFAALIYQEFSVREDFSEDRIEVARLTESVEAEWEADAEMFKPGQELGVNRLRLKSGLVKLEFADGAEVVLEGPTELLIKGRNKAFCLRGWLSAFVPPRAVGFEVASPTATIVDLGTKFSMQVDDDKSEVHVIQGKIEVRQSSVEKIVSLLGGLAIGIDIKGRMEEKEADPTTFVSETIVRKRKEDYVSRRQEVWERETERQQNDPSLVFRLQPETERHLRRVPGSRDGKSALRFASRNDYVPLSLPQEVRSLTLIASVRLDSWKNISNTLLVGNEFYVDRGVLWQIDRSGIIRFHVNPGGDQTIHRYDTPAVIERNERNTWLTPAVVVDAETKTVMHYIDGRRVCTLPWDGVLPLQLADVTLGNEPPDRRKANVRYFNGAVEDFWIFNRALTPKNISDFYYNQQ